MKTLCRHAIDVATRLGASWADARFLSVRNQTVSTENERVSGIGDSQSGGIGIRVLAGGAWGFAATALLAKAAVEEAAAYAVAIAKAGTRLASPAGISWAAEEAHRDIYQTPMEKDPFTVSLEDKISLLLAVNRAVLGVRGVKKSHAWMHFRRQERVIANTDGSVIESRVTTSGARYEATAVNDETAKSRYFEAPWSNAGYEHIERTPLLAEAPRVGQEAVQHLGAKPCPIGKKDLILHPSHLALTMHESIGHATELDRALGMEESMAGSSFATPDLLGRLRYGSPLMNIACDNTMRGGLATIGYDDDGVPGQRWFTIRDGIFVDYQTNRETCGAIGATRSHGSCRAESWGSIPIVRQSNFSLEPGREKLSLEELIADTKDGIYIEGMGSFSIDQKRNNFQFGGDCFWEIRNGKRVGMLRDVTYQAITTEFWSALDALCDKRSWEAHGVMSCAKGDPVQIAQMSHASVPCRFRGISVGGAR